MSDDKYNYKYLWLVESISYAILQTNNYENKIYLDQSVGCQPNPFIVNFRKWSVGLGAVRLQEYYLT